MGNTKKIRSEHAARRRYVCDPSINHKCSKTYCFDDNHRKDKKHRGSICQATIHIKFAAYPIEELIMEPVKEGNKIVFQERRIPI